MLRGPQTPGELKGRTDRMHGFGALAEVQDILDGLVGRELAEALPRRPGQKEQRYAQLLGGDSDDTAPAAPVPSAEPGEPSLEERVARLEREVAALRSELGG